MTNVNNETNLRVQNLRVKKIKGLQEGSPDFLIGVDADGLVTQIATDDIGGGGGGGAVTSVFGRTGVVAAMGDDYDSSQITNSSSVAGAYVTDALDTLQDEINNIPTTSNDLVLGSYPPSNPGSLQIFSDGVESMTFRYDSSTENFDFNISNNLPGLSDGTSLLYSSIDQCWQTTEKSNIQLDGYQLPSANIIVGNTSNVATAVAMSGDIGISHTGATTIQDGAVTTAKIADKNVTLDKIQDIGQHKLLGRHDTGDGIVHQIGVTGGVEFNGQNIQIQNSGVTQAKINASGAAAGRVLQTDGTNMSWVNPSSGSPQTLIPMAVTTANCVNTTSEITLINCSIPANTVAVGDIINIEYVYSLLQNTGSTQGRHTRFKIDGTSHLTTLGNNRSSNASTYYTFGHLKLYVAAKSGNTVTLRSTNITNSVTFVRNGTFMSTGTSTTDGTIISSVYFEFTFNDSTDKTMALTYQWETTASPNAAVTMLFANAYITKGS